MPQTNQAPTDTHLLPPYLDTNAESEDRFEAGKDYLMQGDYQKALTYFDEALDLNPQHQRALIAKGNVLYDLGRYSDAEVCFDTALVKSPPDIEAQLGKGRALLERGRNEEVLTHHEKYGYPFETELPDARTLLHLLTMQQITKVQVVYLLFNGFNPFLAGRDSEALVTELKKLNLPAINAFVKDCVELHQYILQKQFSEALQRFDKVERRQTDYDISYINREVFKVKERGQRVANGIKRLIVHSHQNPGKKTPKSIKIDSSIYRDLQQQAHPLKVALNKFSQAVQNVYYEGHEGNLLVHIQALKLACKAYPELKIHFNALEALEKDYYKLAIPADNQRLAEVKSGQWRQLDGQRGYFTLFRQYDDNMSEMRDVLEAVKTKQENSDKNNAELKKELQELKNMMKSLLPG